MQLCRFLLREDEGIVRSGIFHEGRLYETDGQTPIGVHDLSKIVMLPPIQGAPSFRVFDSNGRYRYLNSANFGGALTEFDAPVGKLGVVARLLAVVSEAGDQIGEEEAESFILGYCPMVSLVQLEPENDDLPFAIGPFLTIPEVPIAELFKKPFQLKLNGDSMDELLLEKPDFARMIVAASRTNRLLPGDLIGGPVIPFASLVRSVQPGDSLQLAHEEFGVLAVKVV